MRKTTVFTLALILLALVFLFLGIFINQYRVYDALDYEYNGEDAEFDMLKEYQLVEEMCYDAIIRDEHNNLIKKERETVCTS